MCPERNRQYPIAFDFLRNTYIKTDHTPKCVRGRSFVATHQLEEFSRRAQGRRCSCSRQDCHRFPCTFPGRNTRCGLQKRITFEVLRTITLGISSCCRYFLFKLQIRKLYSRILFVIFTRVEYTTYHARPDE